MTTQMDLFGASVRNDDPVTSVEAAASLPPETLSAQRQQVLAAVAHVDKYEGRGSTAHDCVMALSVLTGRPPQRSVVARRLTDLRELGLVRDGGHTRIEPSGRAAIQWELTDAGRGVAS